MKRIKVEINYIRNYKVMNEGRKMKNRYTEETEERMIKD